MKAIKIKVFKEAIKDAQRRGLTKISVVDEKGNIISIREITVSNITGMNIHIKNKTNEKFKKL
jgi:hypothetical protein